MSIVDGKLLYQNAANYGGAVLIHYGISDGNGGTDHSTAHVNILVNSAPIAVDDDITTDNKTPLTIDVLGNDSDPDDDRLTLQQATTSSGTVEIVDNQLAFTPVSDFVGIVTVKYQIVDTNSAIARATVTITVVQGAVDNNMYTNQTDSGGGDTQTLVALLLVMFLKALFIRERDMAKLQQLSRCHRW